MLANRWLRPRASWLSRAFSVRKAAEMESQAMNALRTISDDIGMSDIVSLGRVKDLQVDASSGKVQFRLEAPSPALHHLADNWKEQAQTKLATCDWFKEANIDISFPRPRNTHVSRLSALANVGDVLAVSSCKGGVGKSTVAVNLAYTLSKMGAKVGLLDADIYGPSLPTMVSPSDKSIRYSAEDPHLIEPLEYEGVKCMSFGFVNQHAAPGAGGVGAAVMRGSMVSKLVDQLVLGTRWGELDYLVVDMPPGTGDIQISLSQQLPMAGAVVVTTPQRLSFVDVEKGISMFNDLKVPTTAVVENMSYFDCVHGHRHYPFGKGHTDELVEKYSLSNIFQLPISDTFSATADSGRPYVLSNDDTEQVTTYTELAKAVAKEVFVQKQQAKEAPELLYDTTRKAIVLRKYSRNEAAEVIVHAADLRARCRCAQCIDEFTGQQKLDPETIDNDIRPESVERKGNYAFAVSWSDGHTSSLYTYDHLEEIMREEQAA